MQFCSVAVCIGAVLLRSIASSASDLILSFLRAGCCSKAIERCVFVA